MTKLFDLDEMVKRYEMAYIDYEEIEVHLDLDTITVNQKVGGSHIEFVGVVQFKTLDGKVVYTSTSGRYKASNGSKYAIDKLEQQFKDYGLSEIRTNVLSE